MKLVLHDIKFYGYHGVSPEEKNLGQQFAVDVELLWSTRITHDDLSETIDYQKVFNTIITIGTRTRFNLIESLAQDIAQTLIEHFPLLDEVCVRVKKSHPPLPGIIGYVEAEISKKPTEKTTKQMKDEDFQ